MKRIVLLLLRLVSIVSVAEVVRESQLAEPRQSAGTTTPAGELATGPVREHRSGWSKPQPERTPEPTYWPAVVGLGVMFFTWGIISNLFVLVLGLLFLLAGFAGWIGDLLSEG